MQSLSSLRERISDVSNGLIESAESDVIVGKTVNGSPIYRNPSQKTLRGWKNIYSSDMMAFLVSKKEFYAFSPYAFHDQVLGILYKDGIISDRSSFARIRCEHFRNTGLITDVGSGGGESDVMDRGWFDTVTSNNQFMQLIQRRKPTERWDLVSRHVTVEPETIQKKYDSYYEIPLTMGEGFGFGKKDRFNHDFILLKNPTTKDLAKYYAEIRKLPYHEALGVIVDSKTFYVGIGDIGHIDIFEELERTGRISMSAEDLTYNRVRFQVDPQGRIFMIGPSGAGISATLVGTWIEHTRSNRRFMDLVSGKKTWDLERIPGYTRYLDLLEKRMQGKYFEYWENPSAKEIEASVRKSTLAMKEYDVRLLWVPESKTLYCWDAYKATHFEFAAGHLGDDRLAADIVNCGWITLSMGSARMGEALTVSVGQELMQQNKRVIEGYVSNMEKKYGVKARRKQGGIMFDFIFDLTGKL